jgi:hypothetical protein
MTDPDNDTWSPAAMRTLLALIGAPVLAATILLCSGWLRWAGGALVVIIACAVLMPPFRKPRP